MDSVSSVTQRKSANRRSLNDDEPPAVPPHSAGFNSGSKPKYSYIGITDPDVPPPLPKKQGSKMAHASTHHQHQHARSESTSPVAVASVDPSLSPLKRMWTCRKCSYAYNPLWSSGCDICSSSRSPPSIAQPSLITLANPGKFFFSLFLYIDQNTKLAKYNKTKLFCLTIAGKNGANTRSVLQSPIAISRDSVRYIPTKATLATAESDLEDHLDAPTTSSSWTCKKCTLLNPVSRNICEACGGSKLRSVSCHLEDPTLRKGESWACPSCTLRNPLSAQACLACKNLADFLELPRDTRIASTHHHQQVVICNDFFFW